MPAITVDDITTLERLPAPDPALRPRRVRSVTTAPGGFEGEGFPVRRAFMGVDLADLDPFVHMDQMGEVEYAPGEPKGTPWHPHRGFETVTYMIDGTFEHQDSNGGGGVITNGDTQWMTAGAGILHIEKPPERLVASGGLFHGLQLWVNLPREQKWAAPRYQDLRATEVGLLASHDAGAFLRIIAGELAGHRGPGDTYSPMTMVHATVAPGARLEVPWRTEYNALVYVLAGAGTVGAERHPIRTGQLAMFSSGDTMVVEAAPTQERRAPEMEVLLLGGRPIREPVAWLGPFVMNTRDEVIQAYEDFRAGRLGSIPAVHATPTEVVESSPARAVAGGRVILVATAEGLHRFDPDGSARPVELPGEDVTALGADADDLYAIVDERAVWRRAGAEWTPVAELDGYRATCVAFTDALVVGTSEARLFRLDGGGLEPVASFDAAPGRSGWSTPWGGPPDTRSITEWTPDVYVNVHVGGILRTQHGSDEWAPTIDVDADVHQVAVAEGLVLAACAGGLAVSTDHGDTWTMRTDGLETRYSRAVAVCGDQVLVCASNGPRGGRAAVYRGELAGGAFERCRDGLPESFDGNIDTYCLDGIPDGSLAAFGTEDGRVFASSDAGASWSEVASGLPRVNRVLSLR